MTGKHAFEHLRLVRIDSRPARIQGGGKKSEVTKQNRANHAAHSRELLAQSKAVVDHWNRATTERLADGRPALPAGIPFLLRVDPSLDLDELRQRLSLEIVSEQEDGFVLVAAHDLDLRQLVSLATDFATLARGSMGLTPQVHEIYSGEQPAERLRRLLSPTLFARWSSLSSEASLVVDVGVGCTGIEQIPAPLKQHKRESAEEWVSRQRAHQAATHKVFEQWDALREKREADLRAFLSSYGGDVLRSNDTAATLAALPDSFTLRMRISGKALLDLALNYPFLLDIVEPDETATTRPLAQEPRLTTDVRPEAPDPDAPSVCIIDSGIQERHVLLAPAIDGSASLSFLPGSSRTDVTDYVRPGGHGTRVAGAVLYGENVPTTGSPKLPFWVVNARVLDAHNRLPVEALPAATLQLIIEHFGQGTRPPRVFNQSINATVPARSTHMSTWAATIDNLSEVHDALFVVSAGNIEDYGPGQTPDRPGVAEHLAKQRPYPDYLDEPSSRIANPAQSLQALTVGSVAYLDAATTGWASIGGTDRPSAFSRSGPGIWGAIKPEVVDYGGDYIADKATPPRVSFAAPLANTAPDLVRSTMYEHVAASRDAVGTSFAAPKVARIAARVQAVLPDQPTILYRALVVQSARWPTWAEQMLAEYRSIRGQTKAAKARRAALQHEFAKVVRRLGYGIPNEDRATTSSDFRTTLITRGAIPLAAGHCHVYQVPIPSALRSPGNDFDVRIEVTLSYVASPRRTRRTPRHYLSTWLSWRSSNLNLNETPERFCERVLKEAEADEDGPSTPPVKARGIPWTIQDKTKDGLVRGVRRSGGTVQKDWATVKAGELPASFCLGVIGHRGWNRSPEATARYSLAVTIEVQGRELAIYDLVRAEVESLAATIETAPVEAVVDSGS